MEMSIQTERRRKAELAPINASMTDVDEDEKDKYTIGNKESARSKD